MFQRIEEWILNVGFCLSFLIYFAVSSILSELNKNNTKTKQLLHCQWYKIRKSPPKFPFMSSCSGTGVTRTWLHRSVKSY